MVSVGLHGPSGVKSFEGSVSEEYLCKARPADGTFILFSMVFEGLVATEHCTEHNHEHIRKQEVEDEPSYSHDLSHE